MKINNKVLLIIAFSLVLLLFFSFMVSFSTLANTGWTNFFLKDLAGRSEYSVKELPRFSRIDQITQGSVPYGTEPYSARIGVTIHHAQLSTKQAERMKFAFENPDNTCLKTVEAVQQLMDRSPSLGYTERILYRPNYVEMSEPHEYFIVDATESSFGELIINKSVHFVFYDNYHKCYIAIYEPHPIT